MDDLLKPEEETPKAKRKWKPDWFCFCDTDAMFIPWLVICFVVPYVGVVTYWGLTTGEWMWAL